MLISACLSPLLNSANGYGMILTDTNYRTLGVSSNTYLAQINIRMNERSEQTNDTLNKLTVLGTIVLPMNIITGLWGMNVWVPGQDYEGNLTWFWSITAGLIAFGTACYLMATRVYKIA
jgi:magnesium transporter